MSGFISLLAILALDDSRLTECRDASSTPLSPPPPAHTGRPGGVSSFVTLQLTQKLDAYGIWTACVYWTIGPRVCAAEGGTVRYVTACTCINTERLCVCVCGRMQARAAARLHAAPPAVAPGLRLRAKKRGGAPSST